MSAKICENRLKWFGHILRETTDSPIKSIESIIVESKGI